MILIHNSSFDTSDLKSKLSVYEEIKKQIRELHYEVEEDGLDNPGSELSAAVKSII